MLQRTRQANSRSEPKSNVTARNGHSSALFLAQLPPPVHGVTTISAFVLSVLREAPDWHVRHLWMGSAASTDEIGRISLRKLFGFAGMLARLLGQRALRRRYDICYLTIAPHGDAMIRDALIAACARRLASRTLVHLHTQGLAEALDDDGWRSHVLRRALSGTELIAVSESVGRAMQARDEFRAVHVLPNFVGDPGPRPRPQARRETLRCGYLGNFDPRKGVLRFVNIIAAAHRRNIPIEGRIAGGSTKYLDRAAVEARVREVNLDSVVTVQGFVTGADKSAFFADLDVFLYPTDHDLAPLVVIEAMANGVVPICFDTGAVREMLGADLTGCILSEKYNPEIYQAKALSVLESLLADPEKLAGASGLARARYEAAFTPDRYRRDLAAIFNGDPGPFVQYAARPSRRVVRAQT